MILLLVAIGFTPGTASAARHHAPATPTPTPTATATPTPTATATPTPTATATAVPLLANLKTGQQIVSDFQIHWSVVALLLPLIFWKYTATFLRAIAAAIESRAFTVDVGTFKVTIGERPLDTSIDQTRLFSLSPFELDPLPDRPSALTAIEPQKAYVFSDFVASVWEDSHKDQGEQMRAALRELTAACEKLKTLDAVKRELLKYVQQLEKVRFLKVSDFSILLDAQEPLRKELENMALKDLPDDKENHLILYAAGLAYAHRGDWALATQFLETIAVEKEEGHQLDDKEKIAVKDKKPHYYPACDAWIGSAYHKHVVDLLSKDSKDFVVRVEELLNFGKAADKAIEEIKSTNEWPTRFGVSAENAGYYKRELWKSLGFLYSFLGDYSKHENQTYFDEALSYLERSNKEVDGDRPTPLDRNNLADVYRQLGKMDKAKELVNQALREMASPDPSFYNTQAWIFWNERQPISAFLALQQYGEDEADKADDPQDLEQYVQNQIFAAKLAANISDESRPSYLALGASRLDAARLFVNRKKERLGQSSVEKLLTEIEELLGYLYLELPGKEELAVEAFDRLKTMTLTAEPNAQIQWRRKLGRAKAYTRLARAQRRRSSSSLAEPYWTSANSILSGCDKDLESFALTRDVITEAVARARNFRLRLDTVVAVQALGEESFCEGRTDATGTLLHLQEAILSTLRTAVDTDEELKGQLDGDLQEMRSQVRFYEAHYSFLAGRNMIKKRGSAMRRRSTSCEPTLTSRAASTANLTAASIWRWVRDCCRPHWRQKPATRLCTTKPSPPWSALLLPASPRCEARPSMLCARLICCAIPC